VNALQKDEAKISSSMSIREFLHRANMLEVEEKLVAEKVLRARELLEVKHLIDPEHRYIRGGGGKGEERAAGTTGNKKGKKRMKGKKGKKGKRQGRGRGKGKEKGDEEEEDTIKLDIFNGNKYKQRRMCSILSNNPHSI
jgi:hypothetical protein